MGRAYFEYISVTTSDGNHAVCSIVCGEWGEALAMMADPRVREISLGIVDEAGQHKQILLVKAEDGRAVALYAESLQLEAPRTYYNNPAVRARAAAAGGVTQYLEELRDDV